MAFALAAALACGAGSLVGCAGASDASSSSSSSSAESSLSAVEEPDIATYGAQTDSAKSIVLDNGLGADITNIAVKDADADAYPDGLMPADAAWSAGDRARVCFEAATDAQDVQIAAGDAVYELHGVDLGALGEARLEVQDGVAYLSYEADGEERSTLAAEQDLIRQQQEAAEAERQAAEEAAAQEAAAQEAAAQQQQQQQSSGGTTYDYGSAGNDGGSSSGSNVGGQSGDGCVSGGVVLR